MMTLKDLQAVYAGAAQITAIAYFPDGRYYSFRSLTDGPEPLCSIHDEDMLSKEVISIVPSKDGLWVDVKEIVSYEDKEED